MREDTQDGDADLRVHSGLFFLFSVFFYTSYTIYGCGWFSVFCAPVLTTGSRDLFGRPGQIRH